MVKIGYLSFDASVKVHYSGRYTSTKTSKSGFGGIAGYIRHIDRGTDRKNGCEVQHSNQDINADDTLLNESYYKDSHGEWHKTRQSKDMVDAINGRIEYAKNHHARISEKGKNDTVVVRPLVVQLDNDSIAEHENTWMWDVIEILENQFSKENITGFSIHRDETNLHLHVAFVPCYESEKNGEMKCSINQTKFFQNPKQLAGIHKKIRKSLLDKGYDIEQDNKPIDEYLAGYTDKIGVYHQQGLTPDMLKALSEKELKLRLGEIEMNIRRNELDKLEQAMALVKENAKIEKEELEKERITLENDRVNVQAQLQALLQEKAKVEQMKSELKDMSDNVYSTADICNKILSEEKHLNAKFLEFLDREGKRRNRSYRETVEKLYKKFLEERRNNLDSFQMELWQVRNERMKNKGVSTDDGIDIIDTDYGFSF